MIASAICLLISQAAKGGSGMVAIAGQHLNLVLEDLKLVRNLKMNRVTQTITVQPGTNGPFTLEADYLRTYDMFYPLQTPQGMTQFLSPITMEQYDAEFKSIQTADYPFEFATDLSTQAQLAAGATSTAVSGLAIGVAGSYLSRPTLSMPGGATGTVDLGLVAVAASTSGGGYQAGDIVSPVGGTFTRQAQIKVIQVSAGIGIAWEVLDGGDYTVVPGAGSGSNVPVSGGSGAGMKLDLYWGLTNAVVTAGGGPYSAPPAVTVVGGSPVIAGAITASIAAIGQSGLLYIYPQSNAQLGITHRYMKNQPDLIAPESSAVTPWFPHTQYLITAGAASMMMITGDDRREQFLKDAEMLLAPYLIMEGDEQQAVHEVRLDPRRFRQGRYARPTKTMPY